MSQVFFSFATKDKATADPIIDAVEQAGFSVWHPDMITVSESYLHQINNEMEAANCVVALWLAAAAQTEFMKIEIKRALQAWSSNRLVLVVLDDAELPLGLRDLPAISLKGASEIGMKQVIDRVRSVTNPGTFALRPAVKEPLPLDVSTKAQWASCLIIVGAVASIILAAVGLSTYSVPRAPPTPVSAFPGPAPPPQLRPSLLPDIALALAAGLAIGALTVWGWTAWSRRHLVSNVSVETLPKHSSQGSGDAPQVFVSYSRQDGQTVDKLVEQIKQLGYTVWIDRQSTGSQRYAAPIVRAIRTSRLVALMCSAHAFTSDHVIREIYVAGDNKKPFIAFLLDPTELPDEVLYFVSGFPRISITAIDREQLQSEIARLIVP